MFPGVRSLKAGPDSAQELQAHRQLGVEAMSKGRREILGKRWERKQCENKTV